MYLNLSQLRSMGELLKKTFRFSWIGILTIFLVLAYISFSIFSSNQNEEMFGTILFILITFIMIVFSFLLSIYITNYLFSKKQFSSRIISGAIGLAISAVSFMLILFVLGIIIEITGIFFDFITYFSFGIFASIIIGI